MKVSIIVPYTNGIHFLRDCFESLKEQTFKDFEVILVKDQPGRYLHEIENVKQMEDPDELVKEYQLQYEIQVVSTTENSGAGGARNLGLLHAKGEYIYFLDSDDYLLEDTLNQLAMKAEKENLDLVYGTITDTWFKRSVFLEKGMENSTQNTASEEAINSANEGDEAQDYTKAVVRQCNPAMSVIDLIGKKHGFCGISCLNVLIRKEFVDKFMLAFMENNFFYTDLYFIARVLLHPHTSALVAEAHYVKRKHNDPIHYPAVSQIKSEDKVPQLVSAYEEVLSLLSSDKESENSKAIKTLLEFKFVNYYTNYFATKIRRSDEKAWATTWFSLMKKQSHTISKEVQKELSGYKKKLLRALIEGNLSKTKRIVMVHLGFKKVKRIHKNRRAFSCYLYFHFFTKMKMKENWVLFESFFGKSYSDSPKYIYEYLNKTYPGQYKCVWVINDRKTEIPYNPVKVKRFSIRYAYYFARCKYDVLNVRQPNWIRKRKGNVFLETWHGTPLKRLVFDQEEVCGASPQHKQQFYRQSRDWDYLISDNRFSTETFKRAFLFHNEIVECGYPRNDVLYAADKEMRIQDIKSKLKIPMDKKLILYAPTWRDDEYYGKGEYKFALKLDLHRLKKELGKEYVILLRTHYYIADSIDTTGLEDFAFNVSKYNDISELYLISDLLITDYSSVFFDYANLCRPILFYTYDLEKYRDMLRGFYLDIEKDMPGPLLYTEQEVIEAIKNIEQITKEYKERYQVFYDRFCHVDDGNASKRIVEKVFKKE